MKECTKEKFVRNRSFSCNDHWVIYDTKSNV